LAEDAAATATESLRKARREGLGDMINYRTERRLSTRIDDHNPW
jgi:hypothetical protein